MSKRLRKKQWKREVIAWAKVNGFDPSNQSALIWSADDVRYLGEWRGHDFSRGDLTDAQCVNVLEAVMDSSSAEWGIGYPDIREMRDSMFPATTEADDE
jgi:hypothetical protein